ncbi:MAG: hypothetical protein JWO36_4232 [Myxococcales bacterium]|nr:hypothetical protein [Myxococcales bacterium]
MRALVISCVLLGCKSHSSSAIEVTDRAWRAHEIVVGVGERAGSCADAGLAMERAFTEHREAFIEAIKLDSDPDRLAEATSYLETHQERYSDLEARMDALAERCSTDAKVQGVFRRMETP